MNKIFTFSDLSHSDLVIDAVYEGGTAGNTSDDPLSKLLYCGNQGGFRKVGSSARIKYVVLYSSLADKDWPDSLDTTSGIFTYYGDNKTPGHELHRTSAGGNLLLRDVFSQLHTESSARIKIPPFLFLQDTPQIAVDRYNFED